MEGCGVWQKAAELGRNLEGICGISQKVEFIALHCNVKEFVGETESGGNLEGICGLSEEFVCIIALHFNVKGLCWGEVGVSIGGLGFAEGGRVGGSCGFS